MTTLRLLISDSYDPWFNLAVEECIFRQMPATQRVLFLWRNADTVVIDARKTRGKSVIRGVWKKITSVWPAVAAAAARYSMTSVIPALPLWPVNRNTIKPSPPILCSRR